MKRRRALSTHTPIMKNREKGGNVVEYPKDQKKRRFRNRS